MRPYAEPLASRISVHSDQQVGLREDDPINFASVLRFIQLRWRILIAWTAAAICAAMGLIVESPSYYTAYTTLLLEASDARQGEATNALLGLDPATYVYSQIELIQSDEVLERVMARLHLVDDIEFGRPVTSIPDQLLEWARAQVYPRAPHEAGRKGAQGQETMIRVRRALSIRRLGISDAVEVSFTAQSPERAAVIANSIAKAYIDGKTEQKLRAREDATTILRQRLARLREKMYDVGDPRQAQAAENSVSANQARERFRELQGSADAYRNLYTAFLQREYMSPGGDPASSSGRVITPAKPPVHRSSPRTLLVLAIAVVIGGSIGFGHALLRHLTEQVVRAVADLEPFAHFDQIRRIAFERKYRWRRNRLAAASFQPAYTLRCSRVSNTLSKVAVRLQLPEDRGLPRIIGVVACSPGAGASSIASHLASILAEAGGRILLVDANWRKKQVSTRRSDLNPQSDEKVVKSKDTIPSGLSNLDVLAIRVSGSTSDVTASRIILDAVRHQCAEHYDYVVVDFHSTEETVDMESTLGILEKLIVVAEASRTSLKSLRSALKSLPSDKLSSLLLNKA